jgi:hypothetical protein
MDHAPEFDDVNAHVKLGIFTQRSLPRRMLDRLPSIEEAITPVVWKSPAR